MAQSGARSSTSARPTAPGSPTTGVRSTGRATCAHPEGPPEQLPGGGLQRGRRRSPSSRRSASRSSPTSASGLLDADLPVAARRAARVARRRTGGAPDARRRRRPRHLQRRQAARRTAGRASSSAGPTSSTACAAPPARRALRRGDKMLAALQEPVLAYLHARGEHDLRSGGCSPPRRRAARAGVPRRSRPRGSGATRSDEACPAAARCPASTLPSCALALDGDHLAALPRRPTHRRRPHPRRRTSRPAHRRPRRRRPPRVRTIASRSARAPA